MTAGDTIAAWRDQPAFANGVSSHGIPHSSATGRGVAELIADGGYVTLDLSPLGFDRIPAGLVERTII